MKNYFTYKNIKYIVEYEDNKITLYKWINNEKIPLTETEEKEIINLLTQEYSYQYNSEKLEKIVLSNPNIEDKEHVLILLTWLESIIKEEYRENFYRNLTTLKTKLNLHVDLDKLEEIPHGYTRCGGYNTRDNSIEMDEESQKGIWKIATHSKDKENYYWSHYNQILLHELAHMASTQYDSENEIALSGFDKYPSNNIEDHNRGLTEGFTEIISMAGSPINDEIASGYFIEICLIYQLTLLIGKDTFFGSYFTNQGTKKLEDKCKELINHPTKSFELFRNIELNYMIRHNDEEQNFLGNIQSSLLDYLEAKLKLLSKSNKQQEINQILQVYDSLMVTKDKLKAMGKNPSNYRGIDENIMKFEMIKDSYSSKKTEENKIQL